MESVKIELITTGTELLTGEVTNTHVNAIGERLEAIGLQLTRQTSVPDGGAIEQMMVEACGRADVVLVTGGLGPTPDDVTREAAARIRGSMLLLDPAIVEHLENYFRERNLEMSESNIRQAYVPTGAKVLPNDQGTAPGLHFPADGKLGQLFLIPGPPSEMLPVFEHQVMPVLQRLAGEEAGNRIQQTLRVMGLGESRVVEILGADFEQQFNVGLAYCIGEGDISLRLSGPTERVASAAGVAIERLGENLVSAEGRTLAEVIVERLSQRGQTLAVAESCTGGGLGARLTSVGGASAVLGYGWITYSNTAKQAELHVSSGLLEQHGAVSGPVAAAMATGAMTKSGADWALAVSGIAGPGGGSEDKPVGTVYIALAGKELPEPRIMHRVFRGRRHRVRSLSEQHALDLLRRSLP